MNWNFRILVARLAVTAIALAACALVRADERVRVTNAWSKPTVPGQSVAGAYLDIVSDVPATLLKVESPEAAVVELHSMKMEGDVMRMRAVPKIDLPAGKEVRLEPGGLHVMLMDIRKPFKVGEKIPLTLVIESGGKTQTVNVSAEVKNAKPGPAHHH